MERALRPSFITAHLSHSGAHEGDLPHSMTKQFYSPVKSVVKGNTPRRPCPVGATPLNIARGKLDVAKLQ